MTRAGLQPYTLTGLTWLPIGLIITGFNVAAPKKHLGQHWLRDRSMLETIADAAELSKADTVLEIGPGLGTLTSVLLGRAKQVVAVEFDEELAAKLPGQFPGKNLEVIHADILTFDLSRLPRGYKVVANVPYYITSKIIQHLMTAKNKPAATVLLVQKEVAQRLAAASGAMSILAVSAQSFAEVSLGITVPAKYLTPPPKVDSAVVILKTRSRPVFKDIPEKTFFRVVRAGFSAPRKKLVSSLAGGLGMSKEDARRWLDKNGISPDLRAESLTLEDWTKLARL